jgi:hypothetical protein
MGKRLGIMKKKYFVYHGYVSPNSYDAREDPVYQLTTLDTEEEVSEFKKTFMEDIDNEENYNPIFTVIEGRELKITPTEKIRKYKLE